MIKMCGQFIFKINVSNLGQKGESGKPGVSGVISLIPELENECIKCPVGAPGKIDALLFNF